MTLPLEAIELDAFRRRHEHDTFWCGLLLGGRGLQLTTKLYTECVISPITPPRTPHGRLEGLRRPARRWRSERSAGA
ncbi:hypothetical protein [Streptomyces mirabilis]